jgi:hypothetical protein
MASIPSDPDKKALELRAAAADLAKKSAEAELAALKLRIGEVPASGIKGEVTTGTNAGAIEAHLLSALVARRAAALLAKQVGPEAGEKIAIVSVSEVASLQQSSTLLFAKELMQAARANALATEPAAAIIPDRTQLPAGLLPIPAIGLGLDALSKIVGYFRSDFTVSGTDTPVDDVLFIAAIAEALMTAGANVFAPSLQPPSFDNLPPTRLFDLMKELVAMQAEAAAAVTNFDQAARDLTKSDRSQANGAARDAWKIVLGLYDTFVAKLVVPDAAGRLPLVALATEMVVKEFASPGKVLVVKPHRAGGSFITRKNLWTSLGANPFTVAGGVVLSYAIFDGSNGTMLRAAVLPSISDHYPLNHVKLALDAEICRTAAPMKQPPSGNPTTS